MSVEDNKAVVGRWFTEFWGPDFNPAVIDEIAAPDIRFEYSLHAPCKGRDAVRGLGIFAGGDFQDVFETVLGVARIDAFGRISKIKLAKF